MPRTRLRDLPSEELPIEAPALEELDAPEPPASPPDSPTIPEHERCGAGGRHAWVETHESNGVALLGCRNCKATKPRIGYADGAPASYSFSRGPNDGGGF